MKYHIIASKQIKECKCTSCRAKHGQYDSLENAEKALIALIASEVKQETNKDTPKDAPKDAPKKGAKTKKKVATDPTPIKKAKKQKATFPKIIIPPNPSEEELKAEAELRAEQVAAEQVLIEEEAFFEEGKESEDSSASYFNDDLEFLKGDDKPLIVNKDSGLFEQMENVVSWHLDNFYDEKGKRNGKYTLRSSPPILRVENSSGGTVEIVLTKHLAITLAETFETVKRGYYGVDAKRKDSLTQGDVKNKVQEVTEWAKVHPSKAFVLSITVILLIITAFVV